MANEKPEELVDNPPVLSSQRERLWRIIFLSDTRAGRGFDIALLIAIAASVLLVMVESVAPVRQAWALELRLAEWFFTALFTLELLVRLWVVRRPRSYLFSFFGVVDVLAILPSYLELFAEGSHFLMVVRVLRLLRMFRILKMAQHIGEAHVLVSSLRAARRKIVIFMFSVATLVCVEGTLVYLIENEYNPGFANIPSAMYWTIVTITTVGYGDIIPVTVLGKIMASIIMLTGFAIIAVPTGVVTAELSRQLIKDDRRCRECGWVGHDNRAAYCLFCGTNLRP